MADNEETGDALFSHIKFAIIVILLLMTVVFMLFNRYYPKDAVDQVTIDKMEQMVSQMHDLTDSMNQSATMFNKSNQQLADLLNQRGVNRESLYQNMLNQYSDSDASKLRPPSDDIGSQHPATGGNTSQPNGDIR